MHDKEKVVVHRNTASGFHYADVNCELRTLYTTPLHADRASLAGWVADFQDALRDARCIWCGDPALLIGEVEDLDVYGWCSEACYTEALRESEDMARSDR